MRLRGAAALVVLLALAARAQEPHVLARFDDASDLERVRVRGGTAAVESGRLVVAAVGSDAVTVVIPAQGLDLTARRALALRVHVPDPRGVSLRLAALDASGAARFVRPVAGRVLPDGWCPVEEPLAVWRWGEGAGDWAQVTAFELTAERTRRLEVDDVRLAPGDPGAAYDPAPIARLHRPLAEQGVGAEASPAGPFLLQVPVALASDEGLTRTRRRLAALGAWLDRVAAEAVRPIHGGPVLLVVCGDRPEYEAFFRDLGRLWRVSIAPPGGSGYAVQDVCAIAHDAEHGLDRPVIVHEALHALAARRLRLVPGDPRHAWLQEGLANYVQLALHPGSFDARTWRPAFRRGIDGRLLRPLRELVAARVPMDAYPQVASTIAFLLADRPRWLGPLARDLADGVTVDASLARLGSSVDALEADWLAWGRATYAATAAEGDRHWPAPPEWSE